MLFSGFWANEEDCCEWPLFASFWGICIKMHCSFRNDCDAVHLGSKGWKEDAKLDGKLAKDKWEKSEKKGEIVNNRNVQML